MLQQKFSILKNFYTFNIFPFIAHHLIYLIYSLSREISRGKYFFCQWMYSKFFHILHTRKIFIYSLFKWNIWVIMEYSKKKRFFGFCFFYEKCFQFLMIIIMKLKCSFWFFWNCLLYLILNRANSMKFWKNSFIK